MDRRKMTVKERLKKKFEKKNETLADHFDFKAYVAFHFKEKPTMVYETYHLNHVMSSTLKDQVSKHIMEKTVVYTDENNNIFDSCTVDNNNNNDNNFNTNNVNNNNDNINHNDKFININNNNNKNTKDNNDHSDTSHHNSINSTFKNMCLNSTDNNRDNNRNNNNKDNDRVNNGNRDNKKNNNNPTHILSNDTTNHNDEYNNNIKPIKNNNNKTDNKKTYDKNNKNNNNGNIHEFLGNDPLQLHIFQWRNLNTGGIEKDLDLFLHPRSDVTCMRVCVLSRWKNFDSAPYQAIQMEYVMKREEWEERLKLDNFTGLQVIASHSKDLFLFVDIIKNSKLSNNVAKLKGLCVYLSVEKLFVWSVKGGLDIVQKKLINDNT